jgi:hypothetical protein
LRNGDRPTGQQIVRHLASVFAALPMHRKVGLLANLSLQNCGHFVARAAINSR